MKARKYAISFVCFSMACLLLFSGVTTVFAEQSWVQKNQSEEPKKVYVCKYVGTPGVDERLQTGQNPIEVSINAIPGWPVAIGSYFADQQGRSFVLGFVPMVPEPTIADCPTPEPTPTATQEPTVTPTEEPTPTATQEPTQQPTPTATLKPTVIPTENPTPTATQVPTQVQTQQPTPTPKPQNTGAGGGLPWTLPAGLAFLVLSLVAYPRKKKTL